MNNRFKLALNLLTYRRQKGFALVLCFAVGAVMVLTGAAIMTRASSDQTKAAEQKKAVESKSVAEAGIVQYINMLNSNPKMAAYPVCLSTRNSDGTCPTGKEDWSKAVAIMADDDSDWPTTYCANQNNNNNTANTLVNPANIAAKWSKTDWKPLGNGSEYKLIDYGYIPDNVGNGVNSTPGTATLIIRGRTTANDANAGITQVTVTFRVTSETDGEEFFPAGPPGLWAHSFNLNGTNKSGDFRTNVLDSSGCDNSGNTAFPKDRVLDETLINPPFAANTPATYTKEVKSFPDLPSLTPPTGVNTYTICLNNETALPRVGDLPEKIGSSTYIYINNCNFALSKDAQITFGKTGTETIKIYSPNNPVKLGVNGNGKQPKYNLHTAGANTTKVVWILGDVDFEFGGATDANNGTAKNFQFYIHGDNEINLHGNPELKAFVFAPNSPAVFSGNVDFHGTLWVKSYRDNGSSGHFIQTLTEDDLDDLDVDIPEPKETFAMATVNSWSTAEAVDVALPVVTPVASPTASASPSPSPTASASPSPSPTASASPSPSPTRICLVRKSNGNCKTWSN